MTLGNAPGEEAALANVIVEMFQTPISAGIKRDAKKDGRGERAKGGVAEKNNRRESIKEGNLQPSFLHGSSN